MVFMVENTSYLDIPIQKIFACLSAWIIIAALYYIPDMICPDLVRHGGHSTNIIDLIGDITINWDFWLNDELTFWYIPQS